MSAFAPVKVASAGSTLYGASAVTRTFPASAGGARITISTDHGHLLHQRALAGQLDADIVMLPSDMVDDLIQHKQALADPVVRLGSVNIGAAIRTTANVPDVSTSQALSQSLQNAPEIVLTLAPTGAHMMDVITQLGVMSEVEDKLRRFDKSVEVNAWLLDQPSGSLAFGPATEIIAWKDRGIEWCGPIPAAYQVALPYSAALLTSAANSTSAQTFLKFLTSHEARGCFAASGVELADPGC